MERGATAAMMRMTAEVGRGMALKIVTKLLNLNTEAAEELTKIDTYDFNIFTLRDATNGNEMLTVLTHLMARRGCIGKTQLNF